MTANAGSSNSGALTPAIPVLAAEVSERERPQDTGFDLAAMLTIGLVVLLFHVLDAGLRNGSPTGQAFRADTLRRVITVILGFLVVLLYTGERDRRELAAARLAPSKLNIIVRKAAGALLGLYTAYVASYVFLGMEIGTDSILPFLAEIAALLGAVFLWQPWKRMSLYRKQMGHILPPMIAFFSVLILWELMVKSLDIRQFLLPAPSVIGNTFSSVYPRLVNQGWQTFQNALWGYAFGCGAGILFGLASARFVSFSKALLPYAIAVNSIPIIAFAPITNAWFGVTNPMSKIAIVAILTFFPAMINTVRGLTSADPSSLELMRSLAASELTIFRKVRLPVALPYIFNGLKISTSLSMIGAIVAEYFGGPTTGLGVQISSNAALIRFPLVWSQIIIASLLGIIFYFVVSLAERLIMPWHVTFRPRTD